jgi:hypothetical protein
MKDETPQPQESQQESCWAGLVIFEHFQAWSKPTLQARHHLFGFWWDPMID